MKRVVSFCRLRVADCTSWSRRGCRCSRSESWCRDNRTPWEKTPDPVSSVCTFGFLSGDGNCLITIVMRPFTETSYSGQALDPSRQQSTRLIWRHSYFSNSSQSDNYDIIEQNSRQGTVSASTTSKSYRNKAVLMYWITHNKTIQNINSESGTCPFLFYFILFRIYCTDVSCACSCIPVLLWPDI